MLKLARLCAVTLVVALVGGAAFAQDAPPKLVTFDRLVQDVPKGQLDRIERGNLFLCGSAGEKGYSDGIAREIKLTRLAPIFRSVFKATGLHPEGEAVTNLFDEPGSSAAQYVLRGVITGQVRDVCYTIFPFRPQGEPTLTEAQRTDQIKGDYSFTVNWQLLSRVQNKVVFQKTINNKFSQKTTIQGGPNHLAELAFEDNLRLLAADPALRAELAGPAPAKGKLVEPERQDAPIPLEGTRDVQPRPLREAVSSVMIIFAGDALGSGVLISRDGYILTDAHVVGASTIVRLMWSDGKETAAQVVRVSAARDVALLKTEVVGSRNPLPMQDTPPPVGSTVYAIGSPEGQQFAGTLTRGIVSSVRVMNGLNYIQSDVTTGHGGSGGPLLDEKGYVIGLTDLAYGHDSTSSGLNFFTPVKDALQFLGVEVR